MCIRDRLIYAKDALVTTVTTGEDGKAVADNLPLGSYYVVEKTAPEGFVLNHDRSDVAFVYADQDTPVIEQEVTVGDDRQKVAIQVEKQDAENGATVAGAVFGCLLYTSPSPRDRQKSRMPSSA